MRPVIAISGLVLAAMLAALAYGFLAGDGWSEVRALTAYPWFNVTIVDVYAGLVLFGVWIAYRERPLAATLWIVALLALGNVLAALYALLAAARSRGDWSRFWLGRRAPGSG